MPFSSRYSIPGFLTQDPLYLPRVDSIARTFRILVIFVIDFEVHGVSFFQLPWTIMAGVLLNQRSQPGCSWGVLHSYCESASPFSSAWVIWKKYVELVRHAKLCTHNSGNRMFLWVVLFSCSMTFVYQLIVKGMCAIVFIDAYYSCGPSSHSIQEWLGAKNSSTSSISRIGSK